MNVMSTTVNDTVHYGRLSEIVSVGGVPAKRTLASLCQLAKGELKQTRKPVTCKRCMIVKTAQDERAVKGKVKAAVAANSIPSDSQVRAERRKEEQQQRITEAYEKQPAKMVAPKKAAGKRTPNHDRGLMIHNLRTAVAGLLSVAEEAADAACDILLDSDDPAFTVDMQRDLEAAMERISNVRKLYS